MAVDIKISTSTDLQSLKRTTTEISDALNKGIQSDALKVLDKDAISLRSKMVSLLDSLTKIDNKIDNIASKSIDTELFREAKTDLDNAENAAKSTKQALDELVASQERNTAQVEVWKTSLKELQAIMDEGNQKNGQFMTSLETGGEEQNNWTWIKQMPENVQVWRSSVDGLTYSWEQLKAMTDEQRQAINLTDSVMSNMSAESRTEMVDVIQTASDLSREIREIQSNLDAYVSRNAEIAKLTQKFEDQSDAVTYLKGNLQEIQTAELDKIQDPELGKLLQHKEILLSQSQLALQQAENWDAVNSSTLQNIGLVKQLESELAKAGDKVHRLEQQKFELSADFKDENSPEYKQVNQDLLKAKSEYNDILNQINAINSQTQQTSQNTSAWRNVVDGIKSAFRKLPEELEASSNSLKQRIASMLSTLLYGFNNLIGKAQNLHGHLKIFDRLKGVAKSISDHFKNMGKHMQSVAKEAKKSAQHLGKSTLRIAKALIGVRGLFALIRKIKAAIKEGITNLSKAEDLAEGKALKDNLDTLTAKFTQLKNSIGAAFAPLIQVVTPIISRFVDTLTNAFNSLAQFIGALSGVKTVAIAKILDKDAVAAENLGKKQEKANKQLMKFDELNNITTNDKDTSNMFESVGVSDEFGSLVDKLKEMWKLADFTELGRRAGESFKTFLDGIPWDKIQENAYKLGKSLATLINGFIKVDKLGYSIGKTFAEGINTIFYALYGFIHNLDWTALGHFLADGLNGLFENIDWDLIRKTFIEGAQGLVDSINEFIKTFHWDNLSTFIANAVNTIVDAIYTFFGGIHWEELGANIEDQLDKTIRKINWSRLGESLGLILNSAIEWLKGFIEKWNENQTGAKIVHAIFEFFNGVFRKIDFKDLGRVVGGILTAMIDIVKAIIREWKNNDTGTKVKSALKDFFEGIAETVDLQEAAKIIIGILGAKLLNLAPVLLEKGIGFAISKLLGTLATTGEGATALGASGSSIALALGEAILLFFGGLEIGKKILSKIFGENEDASKIINERWKGVTGTFQMIKDGAKGVWEEFKYVKLWSLTSFAPLPRYIEGLSTPMAVLDDALAQVDKGLLYTTDDLNKMRTEMGLSSEDIETIRQAMWDSNEELGKYADSNEAFWELAAGDMQLYKDVLSNIEDGHINNKAKLDAYLDAVEKGTGRNITLNEDVYNSLLSEIDAHNAVKNSQNDLTASVSSNIEKTNSEYDSQTKKIDETSNAIKNESTATKQTATTVSNSLTTMNGAFSNHHNAVQKSATAVNDLKDTYKKAGNEIDRTAGKSKSWGSDMITNIVNGISSGLSSVKIAVSGVAEKIRSFLHFTKPDEGPLADFDTYMPDMMQGLANGIESNMHLVQNMLNSLTASMVKIINGIDMSKMGSNLTHSLINGLQSGISGINSVMNNIARNMGSSLSNIVQQARRWGMDLMQGLINGIYSMFSYLTNAVSNVANTIWSYLHFSEPEVGPLKDFHTFMPDMMDNMVNGIEQGIPDVEAVLSKLSYGIAGGVTIPPKMAENIGRNTAQAESSLDASTLSSILANTVGSLNLGGNSQQDNSDIVIQIDGKEIFRAVRNENNSFINRTGRSAFVY